MYRLRFGVQHLSSQGIITVKVKLFFSLLFKIGVKFHPDFKQVFPYSFEILGHSKKFSVLF